MNADSPEWAFDNSYARLPDVFFTRTNPAPVREPRMALFNRPLAGTLGLDADALDTEAGAAIFSGNNIPAGAEPIAQAYAGHQFGHLTMLGDGRAILLGEHIAPGGSRWDVQLKGSGRTPFSRRGDGRATLGPMLREYILSEAMHALGIPTTRSLAVAQTGETVVRDGPLPGAVLTRIAASHIRVGTFEYAARSETQKSLPTLVDYTIRRHFPGIENAENPALALLSAVIERQASLIAQWMLVGFVHGVMNTDNMAVSGETIDYGPCAFLDEYDPGAVFSSIDQHGRYAYENQPSIAHWNLARFAETLLPLFHSDADHAIEIAKGELEKFPSRFRHHWLSGMRAKLGLFNEQPGDAALISSLLEAMKTNHSDYTNTLRELDPELAPGEPYFTPWHETWQARLANQPQTADETRDLMCRHNPAVIPRNHNVESALKSAVEDADFTPLKRLLAAISAPYKADAGNEDFRTPPPPGGPAYQTFCGT